MNRTLLATLVLTPILLASAPQAHAQHLSADGGVQTFNYLADQYFSDVYFHFGPTAGTSAGLHQYDDKLEDYSATNIQREIAALHTYEKKVEAIDPSALDASVAGDRAILLNSIRSTLLTLEVIRPWEKNPDNYSSGITNSAFVIMERPYASADIRLKALVARENQMPQVLLEARKNLKNPPHIYTEIALEQIDDIIGFFQTDVPSAFTEATDADTKAAFAKSNAAVIEALKSYAAWLKSDLLPRSNGDFKFGADTFAKKLSYDEMVDIPLDRLLDIAFADLHKNQAEFARVAKEVDPSKTPQQVLAELATIHPAPDKLLSTFNDTFASLIDFINTHHIITIPSKVEPTLEETPPFMRATTQASMDPPGPFETHSTKAYFNVTLPEKSWTPEHIAEHMAAFNVGTVISTSVHEAYPGHYVQFLWTPQFPSTVRKILGANTNIEGWAHYTEQMMLDQGYGQPGTGAQNEREAKLIRLGQIQDALLRDARFVNSIKLHTGQGAPGGQWTIDQAVNFFVTDGYQSHSVALVETKRGTADATYLYYTLGKLEIMKLRADMMKKQGAAFNLQTFHDDFMRQGFAPIKIVRKAMLHDDSPVL
ncbi:DUF885 domain-containing protein [Tunturiibacter gelidoferens]|uniref:Uncharacterized protein (DUF885 family) n=1 Tax=Tunturiibacter gelidiferens TaxID=3069689 RepID=A0ACC5P2R7_9BACT|nr:DUF885 domain-containing protein [Edaphobacter lichenicola]MBB5341006.1 uncharacterized protein (DUF885 family) [Edaphobacter lichenicola]